MYKFWPSDCIKTISHGLIVKSHLQPNKTLGLVAAPAFT